MNRLWAQLLSISPFSPGVQVFLISQCSWKGHRRSAIISAYQFNTERRLVEREQPEAPVAPDSIIKIRSKATKEELATLSLIPWQDGGVIRKKGKIPLLAILALVLGKETYDHGSG